MTVMVYVDETGDTGDPSQAGASACYALGCVAIQLDDWASVFEQLVDFRRALRASFGIPMRQELKANYLIRNSGGLRPFGLSPSQRRYVYRAHLRLLRALPAEAFAVVTDKAKTGVSGTECFDMTWEMALQRFERQCTYENTTLMICHDDGENDAIRRTVRKARRHLTAGRMAGGGGLRFSADRILEDPIPRNSEHSYLIQMADMVAYAGWRTYMAPSRTVAEVVPGDTWNEIGPATRTVVNSRKLNGSVPGVVLRTR